jgi:hypothetical protein
VIDGLADGLPHRAINAADQQVAQALSNGLKTTTNSNS